IDGADDELHPFSLDWSVQIDALFARLVGQGRLQTIAGGEFELDVLEAAVFAENVRVLGVAVPEGEPTHHARRVELDHHEIASALTAAPLDPGGIVVGVEKVSSAVAIAMRGRQSRADAECRVARAAAILPRRAGPRAFRWDGIGKPRQFRLRLCS